MQNQELIKMGRKDLREKKGNKESNPRTTTWVLELTVNGGVTPMNRDGKIRCWWRKHIPLQLDNMN